MFFEFQRFAIKEILKLKLETDIEICIVREFTVIYYI